MSNKKLLVIISVLFVILLTIVVLYLITLSRREQLTESPPNEPSASWQAETLRPTLSLASEKIITSPYDYEIQSITKNEIVLNGPRGEMILAHDERITKIYKGYGQKALPVSISTLTIGQKVRLEAIPGKSAKVYIIE